MRAALVLCSAVSAAGVKVQTDSGIVVGCDDEGRAHAARMIGARHFDALRNHPCVPHEFLMQLKDGVEDPEDAIEFLGRQFASLLKPGSEGPHSLLSLGSRVVSELNHSQAPQPPSCGTKLPKLIYIGVGHSGSTSLADAMDRHPDLSFGKYKEHNMLWKYNGNKEEFLKNYENEFPVDCQAKLTFDASPRVLFLGSPGDSELEKSPLGLKYGLGLPAVEAVKDLLGADTKFMLMFRDPVPWAMSNQVQGVIDWSELENKTKRRLNRSDTGFGESFTRGQTLTHGMFAHRSCYAGALEPWLKVFPRENFLFLSSEGFFTNPQFALDKVCDFVGVPRRAYNPDEVSASGRRRNAAKAQSSVHTRFHALPASVDCRSRLESLTGIDFGWEDESGNTTQDMWEAV